MKNTQRVCRNKANWK